MRTLHLIPMIHSDPDLGEAAKKIKQAREALYGADRLTRHEEVVATFWMRVEARLTALNASTVKIYQDGLVDGGEMGHDVVRELAAKGSPNFTCIARLLEAGAELRKTEDLALIRKEYTLTMGLVQATSLVQKIFHLLRARFLKRGLLAKRDRFIANQINVSLQEGEVGVLFIGACHGVHDRLNADIQVVPFKPPRLLQAYMKAMKGGTGEEDLHRLVDELTK